jgi:hypothetical protein
MEAIMTLRRVILKELLDWYDSKGPGNFLLTSKLQASNSEGHQRFQATLNSLLSEGMILGREFEDGLVGVSVNPDRASAIRQEIHLDQKVRESLRSNPWISGSFYLFALVLLAVLFMVIGRSIHPAFLPVVIIGSILGLSVVGAFQLRTAGDLDKERFIRLMSLTLRNLPLLRKRDQNTD